MHAPTLRSAHAPCDDLADAVAAAARLAVFAPSSHNSQPWGLAVATAGPIHARLRTFLAGEGQEPGGGPLLVLGLDRARALGSLDAHALEMDLSCGAYLHVFLEALATRGWQAQPTFADETGALAPLLDAGWPAQWKALAVVPLRRTRGASPSQHGRLTSRLLARVTNRAPYASAQLTEAARGRLATVSTPINPGAALAPRIFTERATIEASADLVRRFAGRDFACAAAWRETYAFIHFSDAAARRAERGFAVTQLFGPMPAWKQGLVRAVLSPWSMRVLRYVGFTSFLARSLAALVAAGPALVSLETADRAPSLSARLAAGGALVDLWLRAGDAGLALHPVSVVLQHDDARAALEGLLGARGRLFFFARLGRPTVDFPRTPRSRAPEDDVLLL